MTKNVGWKKRNLSVVLLLLAMSLAVFHPIHSMSHPQQVTLGMVLIAGLLWVTELVPLFVVSFILLAMSLFMLEPQLPSINQDIFLKPFFLRPFCFSWAALFFRLY